VQQQRARSTKETPAQVSRDAMLLIYDISLETPSLGAYAEKLQGSCLRLAPPTAGSASSVDSLCQTGADSSRASILRILIQSAVGRVRTEYFVQVSRDSERMRIFGAD